MAQNYKTIVENEKVPYNKIKPGKRNMSVSQQRVRAHAAWGVCAGCAGYGRNALGNQSVPTGRSVRPMAWGP